MNVFVARALKHLPALLGSVDAATAPHGFPPVSSTRMPEVMKKGSKLNGFSRQSFSMLADALSAAAAGVQLSGGVNFEGIGGQSAEKIKGACNSAQQACSNHWGAANEGGASARACGQVISNVANQTEGTAAGIISAAEGFLKAALPLCALPGTGQIAAAMVHKVAMQLLDCLSGIFEAQNSCAEAAYGQCGGDLGQCNSTPVPQCPAPASAAPGQSAPSAPGTASPAAPSVTVPAVSAQTPSETVSLPNAPSGATVPAVSNAECPPATTAGCPPQPPFEGSAGAGAAAGTAGDVITASLGLAVQASAQATVAIAGSVGAIADAASAAAGGILDMNLPCPPISECPPVPENPSGTECPAEENATENTACEPKVEPKPESEADSGAVSEPEPQPEPESKHEPEPQPGNEPEPKPEPDLSAVPEPEPPAGKRQHNAAPVASTNEPAQPTTEASAPTVAAPPPPPAASESVSSVDVPSAGEW